MYRPRAVLVTAEDIVGAVRRGHPAGEGSVSAALLAANAHAPRVEELCPPAQPREARASIPLRKPPAGPPAVEVLAGAAGRLQRCGYLPMRHARSNPRIKSVVPDPATDARSRQANDAVRLVEGALVRAQELVDRKPVGQAALAWYIEAAQVGDLSLLALLLAHETATGAGPERHDAAAALHEEAAQRHEQAAERWEAEGDAELAWLERRSAAVERDAAQLERDRARVHRSREGRS